MAEWGGDHQGIKASLYQLFDPALICHLVPDLDNRISGLLSGYERRADRGNVVLNTLVDLLFNQLSNQEEEAKEWQPGSMGCGASKPDPSAADPASSMLCDMCQNKFSLLNRKKVCSECGNCFCSTCLPRESGKTRTCSRCRILDKQPPLRAELMKLRVKDLRDYLSRKKINIKSCVEKKDLVELVLQNSCGGESETIWRPSTPPPPPPVRPQQQLNGPSTRMPQSRSWEDDSIRVSDQVPLERSSNFPKSYVESSHRREWFERLGEEERGDDEESGGGGGGVGGGSHNSTSSPPLTSSSPSPAVSIPGSLPQSPVEAPALVVQDDRQSSEEESEAGSGRNDSSRMEVDDEEEQHLQQDAAHPSHSEPYMQRLSGEESGGAVGGEKRRLSATSAQDIRLPGASNPRLLGVGPFAQQSSASVPSSPRRFANQGLVYLSEIQSLDDLKELSAKQAKEILAMNRVNFKGCVEKEELLKIVERLWRQEKNDKEMLDKMEDDSLCKICMDAPIDCVMLECGHMCTCTNCGKQMAECPICRQYVVRVVRTFKA